jgi:hypothetical protein
MRTAEKNISPQPRRADRFIEKLDSLKKNPERVK